MFVASKGIPETVLEQIKLSMERKDTTYQLRPKNKMAGSTVWSVLR